MKLVKCPKCKGVNITIYELWLNSIEFAQTIDGLSEEGYKKEGSAQKVRAECDTCEYSWTLKNVQQITDVCSHPWNLEEEPTQ